MTACDNESSSSENKDRSPISSSDRLKVDSNGYLRNRGGKEVTLRGINLGGWMIQEAWMGPFEGSSGGDKSWTMTNTLDTLDNRFGITARKELIESYESNFITEEDFLWFKRENVNCIRIPFWYRNFLEADLAWINGCDGRNSVTTNPGFLRLDWAINQAKRNGIYVILDLHGAPGGQSMDHSCGTLGKNELWTNQQYEQAAAELWKSIAIRYKDEAAAAAYDLLNEPQNNSGYKGANSWPPGSERAVYETVRMYDRLYREIRAVDSDVIIMMEAIWHLRHLPNPNLIYSGPPVFFGMLSDTEWAGDYNSNSSPQWGGKTVVWNNVMYSMHLYDRESGSFRNHIDDMIARRNNWKTAFHTGEFENDPIQPEAYYLMNTNKINWNKWTYKIAGRNLGGWSLIQNADYNQINLETSSQEQIRTAFGTGLRTFQNGTVQPANGWKFQTGAQWLDAFRGGIAYGNR